jgi:plasmid stabilization system protein ParE
MKRLAFSPTARDDLITIGLYIADDSPARAETFVAELEAKARDLAAWPASHPAHVICRGCSSHERAGRLEPSRRQIPKRRAHLTVRRGWRWRGTFSSLACVMAIDVRRAFSRPTP